MNKYQDAWKNVKSMTGWGVLCKQDEIDIETIQKLVDKEAQYNYEYHGRKVKLHGIYQFSVLIETSSMIGGHNGGVAAYPMAVVEFEHGALAEVRPTELKGVRNNES